MTSANPSPTSPTPATSSTRPASRSPRAQRYRRAGAGAALVLVLGLGVCELAGWPFLASPVQSLLSDALGRDVRIAASEDSESPRFRLHLLGHPRVTVGSLQVANASWSTMGPFVDGENISLQTTWRDLWLASQGGPVALERVSAHRLVLLAERREDGSSSWQFDVPASSTSSSTSSTPSSSSPPSSPRSLDVGQIEVDNGRFEWRDEPLQVKAQGTLRSSATAPADSTPLAWELKAEGTYRGAPMTLLASAGETGETGGNALHTETFERLPLAIRLRAKGLKLDADGQIIDPLNERRIELNYDMSGPSLAEAGAPLGVNLPATPPFRLQGALSNGPSAWRTQVADARIGKSELSGQFEFRTADATHSVPRLTGVLRGSRLLLQDLGPTIGSDGSQSTADPEVTAQNNADRTRRVLPDRKLDLPSLNRMDADVDIRLDQVDLGRPELRDIRQLQGRLTVAQGVLNLNGLQATLAQGRLTGRLRVDAREQPAHWQAEMQAREVKLEQWIQQTRSDGQPPYATGRVALGLTLDGRGSSTAAVLADAEGRLWSVWTGGTLSHLLVEAAGLDIAQGLGVLIKGDDALPVECGALDTTVAKGVVKPKVLLIDTPDSTLWGTGEVSLVDERMALEMRSRPKDFSLLSLRSPIHVNGSLGSPKVSLDGAGLLERAVPAALLATINPLAALIPLVDTGGENPARSAALERCHAVTRRYAPPSG